MDNDSIPRRRSRAGLWLALGVSVPVLGLAGLFIATLQDSRDEIPMAGFLKPDSMFAQDLPGAHDSTADTCTDAVPCRWSVSAETATVMMFATKEDAERVATRIGSTAERSNWIVVDFEPGGMSDQKRTEFMQGVNGINTGS